jgi:membrane-bound lytic murein transglycosylase A
MTRKLAFMLATSVAFGTAPQIAHALCKGSACGSFSAEGKSYSTSEKRAKVVFINTDKSRAIRLKGCVIEAGKCSRTFIFEIEPKLKSDVSEPAATRNAMLDINTADFLPQQGSGALGTPQQCQRQCKIPVAGTCLKTCLQTNAPSPSRGEPFEIPGASLEPASWANLDGWTNDNHADAFATFQASCRPIVRTKSSGDERPVRAALQAVCTRAVKAGTLDADTARRFFEANFRPVRIRRLGDAAGFLTGYYEPIVDGSRFPTPEFTVPLYRRPLDLVAAGATQPGGPFPNRGRAFRQTLSGELVPYYDRGEIEDGALDGQHLEICWLRSATLALLIQIEGSAQVRLEDGTILRITYDAHNGYPFVPIGRVLIDRKIIPREEMSTRRVNEWMEANPDVAKDVRRQNRSVVFFRVVGLTDDEEARGAQGIPLSAGRSIAVDSAVHVYGTPFFIEADLPLGGAPYRRTMIAQDTGSAIVGPARADIYFGAGEQAGQLAGRVRQTGRFTMLLPAELAPDAASSGVPLPLPRPPIIIRPHPLGPLTVERRETLVKNETKGPTDGAPIVHHNIRGGYRRSYGVQLGATMAR